MAIDPNAGETTSFCQTSCSQTMTGATRRYYWWPGTHQACMTPAESLDLKTADWLNSRIA
jgi:hypothetical protein